MAETSPSTNSPMTSRNMSSAVACNPVWSLAPFHNPSLTGPGPTNEETAALTALAAEAAAKAAANAAVDQESMDYVEVLLELPPNPPLVLSCAQPDQDVKPHASHLKLALENYDKQQKWDNYNYPPAMNVTKSIAGLNPLFNPSGYTQYGL